MAKGIDYLKNSQDANGGWSTKSNPGITGIALTATAGPGTWHYSTNGGTTWTAVGAVDGNNSLLLRDSDRLYFQPNADVNPTENLASRLHDHELAACTSRQAIKALLARRHQAWQLRQQELGGRTGWP